MAKTLNLQIVTPEGIAYSDEVEMVGLRAIDGQIGILPNHIRLMTQMLPGEMMVRKSGQDTFLAVGEGLVEVSEGRVAILTDMAVAVEGIDETKAEEARKRAEVRLKEQISAAEIASVNAALARSVAQLRVKRRHSR
jgi:F-type H+-transporting ATPase subunit epsilon